MCGGGWMPQLMLLPCSTQPNPASMSHDVQVQAEQAALQRRLDELKRQQAALAAGGVPMGALPGELDQQAAAGPAGFERLPKRPKVEKAALTLGQALGQLPLDKHPLMVS